MRKTIESLTSLFEAVGLAHHRAFEAVGGLDPDWPLWYADFLLGDIQTILGSGLSRSRLVHCLQAAADEHQARAPQTPWPAFYAAFFAERLAKAFDIGTDQLALYQFPACPFCQRVLRTIEALDLEVELRDIRQAHHHFEALVQARGRATVPVLLIASANGTERWMAESADIVRYLESHYG